MGFLPCPIFSAKPAIFSHNCHRNVSLPSGASLWNGMFGRVEGQYTIYVCVCVWRQLCQLPLLNRCLVWNCLSVKTSMLKSILPRWKETNNTLSKLKVVNFTETNQALPQIRSCHIHSWFPFKTTTVFWQSLTFQPAYQTSLDISTSTREKNPPTRRPLSTTHQSRVALTVRSSRKNSPTHTQNRHYRSFATLNQMPR